MDARLKVTWNGADGDYKDPIDFDLADSTILSIAEEGIQSGYMEGIPRDENANLTDFVVDRMRETTTLPAIILVRPKTPYGSEA